MEKLRQRVRVLSIGFIPFGIALVVVSYWLAGGHDRTVPVFNVYPGCYFGAVDSSTFLQHQGQIENDSHNASVGCLPPYYFLLYGLAVLGVVLCGWTLIRSGIRLFHPGQIRNEDFVSGMIALVASPLMILAGLWMLHLQLSFGFGGGASTKGDIFDTLSAALIVMGLFVIIAAILLALVAELRGKSLS